MEVNQGSQTRTFTYDGLSRLKSALNPEQVNGSGQMVATQYGYDDNSNLVTKTDPRGVLITYEYDELNRVSSRDYSNTPANPDITYTYDTATNGKVYLSPMSRPKSEKNKVDISHRPK